MTVRPIRTDSIEVPAQYERETSLVEDEALRKSIEQSGIQQPLVVISRGPDQFTLIDGSRRLAIARDIELHTLPAVIDELPENADPAEYRDRLRFILDEHRQDLFPTQRAALIKQLMAMFGMKQKHVASYLGVDAGSITNWLAIDDYIEPIRRAVDTGEISLFHARAFDGMTETGQEKAWRAVRKRLPLLSGRQGRSLVRNEFNPKRFPDLYTNPEKSEVRDRKPAKRRRPALTRDDKQLLARDLSLKEVELEDGKTELQQLKREITLATPPIRAIMRSKELREMLPEATREEFERFAEVYC
jgi:ParB/RepB/Spo0J family partition protein